MEDDLRDPEREHLATTGKVLKRTDRCANRPECREWAPMGAVYCSEPCRLAAAKRNQAKAVGGSLVRGMEEADARGGPEPVLGTRHPRENSRNRSGYD